jgi:hypothetical protein
MGIEGVGLLEVAEGLQGVAVDVQILLGAVYHLFVGYYLKGPVQRCHHDAPLVLAIAADVV